MAHEFSSRCTARSKASGKRCKSHAIHGGTVCWHHGGAAPQVQRKAYERMAALIEKGITTLDRKFDEDDVNPATALAVVRDLTKTIADERERETSASTTSVIDEWIESKRRSKP
jgi:hypothetical protein